MILNILQVIVCVLLICVVLLQMQGGGLSNTFGGVGGEFYKSRQSAQKLLVYATVFLALVFAVISILLLIPR